jgi:phospholipid/cholesterol/gamma-HCH transport system substrate-binding protein
MTEEAATDSERPPVARLELKAALLLVLLLALVTGSVLYLMYARGAFDKTQSLVLIAEDAEGVRVGSDLGFAGFAIGRVRRIELGADGNARILIDVPREDAHWLRSSSVFTMVRSVVGGTALRAYSGILTDPPLPDGAERKVLAGDAAAEIPRLVAAAKDLLQNLNQMTAPDSPLNATLANVQVLTDKMKGPRGALGAVFGSDAEAGKVGTTLDRTNALIARTDALMKRLDGVVAKADTQVFGSEGVMRETRATVQQLQGLLVDARATLKRVDGVLQEVQGIAGNTRAATTDLGALRTEVEDSLRKVESLVDEVNRKWPFARDTELKLK